MYKWPIKNLFSPHFSNSEFPASFQSCSSSSSFSIKVLAFPIQHSVKQKRNNLKHEGMRRPIQATISTKVLSLFNWKFASWRKYPQVFSIWCSWPLFCEFRALMFSSLSIGGISKKRSPSPQAYSLKELYTQRKRWQEKGKIILRLWFWTVILSCIYSSGMAIMQPKVVGFLRWK